ncbi:MAG: CCA tRNA nucleotidyltransferase [Anaerovoracaceae bacterium]
MQKNNLHTSRHPEGVTSKAEEIAERVHALGGSAYYVGGYVRDRLLGRDSKDIDIEVHGITEDALLELLSDMGETASFGRSFGIHTLRGTGIDIALPRTERSTGQGHRQFDVSVDPFIGTEAASSRRDFTVNALMQDVLSGEILDYHGGREDLEKGIIRHVNDASFADDPLRVLRAASFASRLGFAIAEETASLCRSIDISQLSSERIEEELAKALLGSDRPSVFFEELRRMDQLSFWFPELEALIDLPQDPLYHPEGDVWIHTMEVIDRAAAFREKTKEPFSFMLLCLCHDFGKAVTTEFIKGRYHAYQHEIKGIPIIETFLKRIIKEKSIRRYVAGMVPLHMRPNVVAFSKPSVKSTNRLFYEAVSPDDLVYFALCDKPVLAGEEEFTGDSDFLWERLSVFEDTMAKPHITGKDLIEAGISPGEELGRLLDYALKLRLAGIDKDLAMKQVMGMAGSRKKED